MKYLLLLALPAMAFSNITLDYDMEPEVSKGFVNIILNSKDQWQDYLTVTPSLSEVKSAKCRVTIERPEHLSKSSNPNNKINCELESLNSSQEYFEMDFGKVEFTTFGTKYEKNNVAFSADMADRFAKSFENYQLLKNKESNYSASVISSGIWGDFSESWGFIDPKSKAYSFHCIRVTDYIEKYTKPYNVQANILARAAMNLYAALQETGGDEAAAKKLIDERTKAFYHYRANWWKSFGHDSENYKERIHKELESGVRYKRRNNCILKDLSK